MLSPEQNCISKTNVLYANVPGGMIQHGFQEDIFLFKHCLVISAHGQDWSYFFFTDLSQGLHFLTILQSSQPKINIKGHIHNCFFFKMPC